MKRALATALLSLVAWLGGPAPAAAHQASDAYLRAGADTDGRLSLQADVALRDLDVALDLDANADGKLSWGEVRTREAAIGDYVAAHLQIERGDGSEQRRCALTRRGFALDRKADGVYAVLRYGSDCATGGSLSLAYGLFRDIDPTHRGLLQVQAAAGGPAAAPLRSLVPGAAPVRLALGGAAVAAGTSAAAGASAVETPPVGGFFAEGLHHILIGADHVLFLVCLLLPLALGRNADGTPFRGRALWWPLLGLVTAFTVAHSITLGLAAWRVLSVPPSVIEPLIALTIAIAAADNLWPILGRRRVFAAFAFGLIHGFGFAGPLLELELPPWEMAKALLQFNLGVEAGQIAVVALAVLVLTPLRGSTTSSGWLRGGSVAAGLVALVWLGERLLNFKVLPV